MMRCHHQQELSAAIKERDAAGEQLFHALKAAHAAEASQQEVQRMKQQVQDLQHKVRAWQLPMHVCGSGSSKHLTRALSG